MELKLNEMSRTKEGDVVEIEGKVSYTAVPRSGQYGWSQWVVIKEGKDEQGCWVYLEQDEEGNCLDKIIKGAYIKLKGTVKEFTNKKNQPDKSVNGKVIDEIVKVENVSQEKPITQPITQQKTMEKTVEKTGEKNMDKVWEDKDLRIARECAIKAVTELAVSDIEIIGVVDKKAYFDFAEEIVDYIYGNGYCKTEAITSEAIIKEFGGTTTEETKEERIAKAQEIVKDTIPKEDIIRNPHLTEPVDNTMATVLQKKQIYGYIDEEGKKLGGIVDSKYIKEGEVNNIGKPENLTKANAIRYWEYWYGKNQALGERDKREMTAQEKEGSPFATKRKPLELVDKNDDSSLSKDLLIEAINKLRKENALDDDAKFTKEIGCNANFKLWHESELTKLKEKLEVYRPNWVKE